MKTGGYIIISVIVIALAIFLWAYVKVTKQEKSISDYKYFADTNPVDSIIRVTLSEFPVSTQFSIAIIDKNAVQYLGYEKTSIGIAERDNKDKVFEIGSISKTFTSALAAYCFINTSLKPDTKLKDVLSFSLSEDVGNITLLQLSNHTSGLPRLPSNMDLSNASDPYAAYDTAMMFENLRKVKLNKLNYSYSNYGAGLLGQICADKLGMSYEKAIDKFIADPLKMEHTAVAMTDWQKKNLVKGLDAQGNETSNWAFQALAGAGAIKSTASDMVKYAKANLDSKYPMFNQAQTVTFKANKTMSLGMGWHIIHKPNLPAGRQGHDILFHNGGTGGYRTCLMMLKDRQKAIIVLSNVSAFHSKSEMIDMLCNTLLDKN